MAVRPTTASKGVEAALRFYRGLKVYSTPTDLLQIYDKTVPRVSPVHPSGYAFRFRC